MQSGKHSRVGEPEVPEVEVTRMLTAEHRAPLSHHCLDERVPDPRPHRGTAVAGHDLRHRPGRDEVVNDGGAGLPVKLTNGDQGRQYRRGDNLTALVDDEAPVGV